MKILCVVIILNLFCLVGQGQVRICGSDDSFHSIPDLSINHSIRARSEFIIPIVFHIVQIEAEEEISDQHVIHQLQILNNAFSGELNNNLGIPERFLSVRGTPGIRFCLASIDPQGNPTSGITRRRTPIANLADQVQDDGRRKIHYTSLGGQDAWDTNLYVNIWVGSSSRFAGKSTFPKVDQNSAEDGIIIDPNFFGSFVTGSNAFPFHLGKTLIHEMGHLFNLRHIWGTGNGGDCQEDDGINDTPLQRSPYTDCPSDGQSCGSDDMFYNYMDFTNDDCLLMFTREQSSVMVNSLMELRSDLINDRGCAFPNTSSAQLLSVYHEPFDDFLQVIYKSGDGESVEYILYDIKGNKISTTTSSAFERDFLPIPSLTSGIYILYAIINDVAFQEKVLIIK